MGKVPKRMASICTRPQGSHLTQHKHHAPPPRKTATTAASSFSKMSYTSGPGRQQSEVAACQQGVTLRAHPASIEELLREFLLNGLPEISFDRKWPVLMSFSTDCLEDDLKQKHLGLGHQISASSTHNDHLHFSVLSSAARMKSWKNLLSASLWYCSCSHFCHKHWCPNAFDMLGPSSKTSTKDSSSRSYPFCESKRPMKPWQISSTIKKLHRHRPQIAYPMKSEQSAFLGGRRAGRQHGSGNREQSRREIMKGDKLGRQGGSGNQEQSRREIMKGQTSLGDKAAAATKSSPEGKSWRDKQAWETRRQRQPRAAQKGNHEGRQAWEETRRQRQPRAVQKGNHEGRQAWETRRQQQPRAVQNGNHEGRQAWETRRQRQPRAVQKGNHEGRQAWETRRQRQPRSVQKGNHEGRQAWETRRQRQPRSAHKGNHEGRQGGSDIMTIWLHLAVCEITIVIGTNTSVVCFWGAHEWASATSQTILSAIAGFKLAFGNVAVCGVERAASHHGFCHEIPQRQMHFRKYQSYQQDSLQKYSKLGFLCQQGTCHLGTHPPWPRWEYLAIQDPTDHVQANIHHAHVAEKLLV